MSDSSHSSPRFRVRDLLVLFEQALFSIGNLGASILAARWFPQSDYGAFAAGVGLLFLIGGFHTAVISEPLQVFGVQRFRYRFRLYLKVVLVGHTIFVLTFGIGLIISGWVAHQLSADDLANALWGLAFAQAGMLSFWLSRRTCYTRNAERLALEGSVLYVLLVLSGFLFAQSSLALTPFTAFVIVGSVAAVLSFYQVASLWRTASEPSGTLLVRDVWRAHKDYGRWSSVNVALYWGSGQIIVLLVPAWFGLAASAGLAAMTNLFRPISLLIQAISLKLIPYLAGLYARSKNERPDNAVLPLSVFVGLGTALYAFSVWIGGDRLISIVYRTDYREYSNLLSLLGAGAVVSVLASVYQASLKAQGRVKDVTVAYAISFVTFAILVAPAGLAFGLRGLLGASVVSYAAFACVILWRHREVAA